VQNPPDPITDLTLEDAATLTGTSTDAVYRTALDGGGFVISGITHYVTAESRAAYELDQQIRYAA
jgi:hypothetical protein